MDSLFCSGFTSVLGAFTVIFVVGYAPVTTVLVFFLYAIIFLWCNSAPLGIQTIHAVGTTDPQPGFPQLKISARKPFYIHHLHHTLLLGGCAYVSYSIIYVYSIHCCLFNLQLSWTSDTTTVNEDKFRHTAWTDQALWMKFESEDKGGF